MQSADADPDCAAICGCVAATNTMQHNRRVLKIQRPAGATRAPYAHKTASPSEDPGLR
jgi:hypothetical protein